MDTSISHGVKSADVDGSHNKNETTALLASPKSMVSSWWTRQLVFQLI